MDADQIEGLRKLVHSLEAFSANCLKIADKTGRSTDEARAELVAANPQGRLVQPQEVADTVLWLAQRGSGAVTGQAIAVCGGELM